MRAWRGLGMVLHAKQGILAAAEPLDSAVVEVHVRQVDGGVVHRLRVERESVILRCDLDLVGPQVQYRVIAAVMPELEFVGLASQSLAQDLQAQADAEDRETPTSRRIWVAGSRKGSGSPGPFETKMPSGFNAKTSSACVPHGTTVTRAPITASCRRMLRLIPKS